MLRRIPFIISLLGMFGGVLIAIFFGVNEAYFKNRIESGLRKNPRIARIANPAKRVQKMASEASKNWRYFQRYHFHATAIGSMAMGILFLINFLVVSNWFTFLTSYMVALGGFLYPFIWLMAGIFGPEMGRSAAKEKFALLGYSGGLFLVGIFFTILLVLSSRTIFEKSRRRR